MQGDDELDFVYFRDLLLEKQRAIASSAGTGEAAARTVELDQARVGRLSRMDALQGQAMSQEAQRRRMREMQRISAALARIEAGEYGYCLHCDCLITPARLEIDPAAPLCVACAEKTE